MDNVVLGMRIRKKRVSKGLTQKQLGELVGTNGQYISRLENGDYTPSLERMVKLAVVLGCSIEYFVWDTQVEDKEFMEAAEEKFGEDSGDFLSEDKKLFYIITQKVASAIGEYVDICNTGGRGR